MAMSWHWTSLLLLAALCLAACLSSANGAHC